MNGKDLTELRMAAKDARAVFPASTVHNLLDEIDTLRRAVAACGTAVGAAVAPECSTEFLAHVPGEVELVMKRKTAMAERHGMALQRAGTAAGLDAGSDMHRDLVPAIERMRKSATCWEQVIAEMEARAAQPHDPVGDGTGRCALCGSDDPAAPLHKEAEC
jgi:hypothetical protein